MAMDNPEVQERDSEFPRILQPLQTIHRRISQNGQTRSPMYRKQVRGQQALGVKKQAAFDEPGQNSQHH